MTYYANCGRHIMCLEWNRSWYWANHAFSMTLNWSWLFPLVWLGTHWWAALCSNEENPWRSNFFPPNIFIFWCAQTIRWDGHYNAMGTTNSHRDVSTFFMCLLPKRHVVHWTWWWRSTEDFLDHQQFQGPEANINMNRSLIRGPSLYINL